MNYYISDLHLGHANVIKFDGRPFENLEEMHNTIISNWNNRVTDEDTVYILGDFCWGTESEWPHYLKQLNGKKVLIQGNHDIKNPSKQTKKYFLDIKPIKEVKDEGRRVILCHYPMPMYRGAYNKDMYMLYGHVHNTREEIFMRRWRQELRDSHSNSGDNRGQFYNVGCMMPWMNYTPRTLDEIIKRDDLFKSLFKK